METAYRLVIPVEGLDYKINVFMKNKHERDRFIRLARMKGLTVIYKNIVDLLSCDEAMEKVSERLKDSKL